MTQTAARRKSLFVVTVAAFLAVTSNAFTPMTSGPRLRPSQMTGKPVDFRPLEMSPLENEDVDSQREMKSLQPTPALVSFFQKLMDSKDTKKSLASVLAFALVFAPMMDANAAMTGGRMGGSFPSSRSSISRPAPRRSYSASYIARPSVAIGPTIGYPYYYSTPRIYNGILAVPRGPSIFDLLFWGGCFAAISQTLSKEESSSATSSVVQVSVALEVPNRKDPKSILSVLHRLSKTSKTDSRLGIQELSSEVALELLRRKSSIVSASATSQTYANFDKALRDFQKRSVTERSKFETETVSTFGGFDYAGVRAKNEEPATNHATMAVVTLLLTVEGDANIPPIRTFADVEQALQRIASLGNGLESAEILWTPEDPSDTLGVRDVIADYPELTPL